MGFEITTHATVGLNGRVTFELPELAEGQRVELVVRTEEAGLTSRRGLVGCLRGEIIAMADDFDGPLLDFGDYQ